MNDLMRHPSFMFILCLLSLSVLAAHAQFHTIRSEKESLSLSKDPFQNKKSALKDCAKTVQARAKETRFDFAERSQSSNASAKLGRNPPETIKVMEKSYFGRKEFSPNFSENKSKTVDFPLMDMSDSLLLVLIKKRLSVCMPLDWIYLTSGYGYRKDPFSQCKKFHDGIDLRCNSNLIYCMLQGKVEKVGYGSTGYGNHIITTHGHLRFLYGHLSEIYVKEGDFIDAGKVIGVSGNSGRSQAPHLHLSMKRLVNGEWISVNPKPFIDALNNYINNVDEEMNIICEVKREPYINNVELTKENLYAALKKHGVKYPKIVLAQAILETGHFSSKVCKDKNNLFGLRHSKGYYDFDHWEESVIAYRDLVQYKYKGSEINSSHYYAFLKKIGYASAKDYIYRVREIAEAL